MSLTVDGNEVAYVMPKFESIPCRVILRAFNGNGLRRLSAEDAARLAAWLVKAAEWIRERERRGKR